MTGKPYSDSTEAMRAVYAAYADAVQSALLDGDPDDALIHAEAMRRMEQQYPEACGDTP